MALGITVDFNANMVKFAQQMDQMQARMDTFQARAEGAATKINSALSGLGVGLSVGGLAAFVKSGIDAADALSKLSSRTGIAVESLAGLKLAADLSDTSIENVGAAINKLGINIAKNGEAFKQLGIDTKDPLEAFLQFADVFSSIESAQQRAAVGAAALGKSYAELAPLLVQGSAALREQIAEGQLYNKVTQEQADAAAAFNDEITRLETRLKSFSINLAGPGVQAINAWIDALSFATTVADGFNPLAFLDAGGYAASGKAGKIEYLNKQINETANAIKKMRSQGAAGQFVDMLFGNNLEELDNKLIKLQAARDKLLNVTTNNAAASSVSAQAVQQFITKTGDAEQATKKLAAAHDGTAKAEAARVQSIAAIVDNLKFEIDLTGRSAEQQAILRDIRSATVRATADEAAAITALIEKKYALIEADEILADGARLAAQQRRDSAAEYERLLQMFSGENQIMFKQFDDAFKARGQGIINDDELARYLENISQGFDAVTGKAKDSTDKMSAYAEQAARNMQDAFADFLFDPFDKGLSGMLDGFLTTIRRMAANAASQNIMEGLFGAGGGFSGGLIGGLFKGGGGGGFNGTGPLMSFQNSMSWGDVGKFFAGLFHDGGVVGEGGKSVPVSPLAFIGAPRYHRGGVAGLKPGEIPAVLLRGEEVLNESDPRHIKNINHGSKNVVNNVTINISTPNADSFRRSERQIRDQMMRALNV